MRLAERRYLFPFIVAGTLGIGILLGIVIARNVGGLAGGRFGGGASLLPPPSPVELSTSFARVAREVEPAVVNINTVSAIRPHGKNGTNGHFEGFFGRYFHFDNPDVPRLGLPQRGLGSGVIMDPRGYILTNYHVITQSLQDRPVDQIMVYLADDKGTHYRAKVVGKDKATDLAVIRIETGGPLPHAVLGDSDSAQVGDWVLAIGSPFGLNETVTAGIISAKARSVEPGVAGQFKHFIQTDAAINPGNSGGPLVNLAGQVIGINTAIETDGGANEGVGFAIPSSTVRSVYNDIIAHGSVQRGAIGIDFQPDQSPALLKSFGADHGVVVNSVEPQSPAANAGLKMGDVILTINGRSIHGTDELVQMVSNSEVGAELRVVYLRNGKKASTNVRVADRSKIAATRQPVNPFQGRRNLPAKGEGALGILVKPVATQELKALDDSLNMKGAQGVVVDSVDPDGVASDMSVERGDVILAINHQPVHSLDDFHRLENQLQSRQNILLLVARRIGQSYETYFLADTLP